MCVPTHEFLLVLKVAPPKQIIGSLPIIQTKYFINLLKIFLKWLSHIHSNFFSKKKKQKKIILTPKLDQICVNFEVMDIYFISLEVGLKNILKVSPICSSCFSKQSIQCNSLSQKRESQVRSMKSTRWTIVLFLFLFLFLCPSSWDPELLALST